MAITADVLAVRVQEGWKKERMAGGWAGRRWKAGLSWEVKENERMAKVGSVSWVRMTGGQEEVEGKSVK